MLKVILLAIAVLFVGLAILIIEAKVAANRPREAFQNPSAEPRTFGAGPPLKYVVMGDSTGAGQGAPYDQGIAVRTAEWLGKSQQVTLVNVSVSGARTKDVLDSQVLKAASERPDVVLIALGANDVTHLTGKGSVRRDLNTILTGLIESNCDTKIVLTGSPDVGAARAFAQPLRFVAGARTAYLNPVFQDVAIARKVTFAPVAEKTGQAFRKDPTLLASDRFHPNERGYATWLPVLEEALGEAIANQPSHCEQVDSGKD